MAVTSSGRSPVTTKRPEIQALRAIAVALVIAFHVWPGVVPGGFIGVDVFFVISGFLITGHLLRDSQSSGRVRPIAFWARRARRLLPASLTVLVAAGTAVIVWMPESYWQQAAREIGASALYVQNWVLAADSVDYLAATNEPSVAQHYWSLSVEEQFYLAWPLLVGLAWIVGRRSGRERAWITATLVAVAVTSLGWSVVATATDQAPAYFSTLTRAWEFASGGILALVGGYWAVRSDRIRSVGSWLGIALVGGSAMIITRDTPFPGWAAVVPVIGTLLVIAAGAPVAALAPTRILALRPIQFLGDVSYSTYLWHWPILIVAPFIIDRELGDVDRVIVVVATIVLAWATTVFVENPMRRNPTLLRWKPRASIALAVSAGLIVAGASGAGYAVVQGRIDDAAAEVEESVRDPSLCIGAAALDPERMPCLDPEEGRFSIDPAFALTDKPAIYTPECRSDPTDPTLRECVFGEPGGVPVALAGDSHAASWFPALEILAVDEGWELHSFFKASCPWSTGTKYYSNPAISSSCTSWNRDLEARLTDGTGFAYIFTAHFSHIPFEDASFEPTEGVGEQFWVDAWTPALAAGATIVAIRDNPSMGADSLECWRANPTEPSACPVYRATALTENDTMMAAAKRTEGVVTADLTRFFCADAECPLVIGGVAVYRDADHISATYARTLAPYLLAAIR